jgi:hypothetical protein
MINETDYSKILTCEDSLSRFLRKMSQFDKAFCDAMASGEDFTLKLEVHGCNGKLIHARVVTDGFDRPSQK